MEIEFDTAKNAANIAKHGVSLAAVRELDWSTAVTWVDDRFDYGEVRHFALGFIGARLHALAFTMRGEILRVINLRRANAREVRDYEQR